MRTTLTRLCAAFLLLPLLLAGPAAIAAEAAPFDSPPAPLPPEAEAAYQDLLEDRRIDVWLDEAVFTEITPVMVPEVGIKLPPDQDQ